MHINSYLAKVIDYIYSDDYKEQYERYQCLNMPIEDRVYTITLDSDYSNNTGILNIQVVYFYDKEDNFVFCQNKINTNITKDKCLNFFIILNVDESALYKKDIKVQYNLFVNCSYCVVYNLVSVSDATQILNYKNLSAIKCFCTFNINLKNKSIYLYGNSNFLCTLDELYRMLKNQYKKDNPYLDVYTDCEKGNYSLIEFYNCDIYFNNIIEDEYFDDLISKNGYACVNSRKLLTLSEFNNIFIKHYILNIQKIIRKPYLYQLVEMIYNYCDDIILIYDLSSFCSYEIEEEIIFTKSKLYQLNKFFDRITLRLILSNENTLRALNYFEYSYESLGYNCIQWMLVDSKLVNTLTLN